MNISGAAFGQRIRQGGGQAGQADNSYDAKIQKLQAKRAEYVEKLQKVREEAQSAEHAKQLSAMYTEAISGIDMQITQLQKAKAQDAKRKMEEQAAPAEKSEGVGAADAAGKTKERDRAEFSRKADEVRDRGLVESSDEERFGIRRDETPEERREREEEYLGTLIDVWA